jgi:hypothetical protein
MRIHTLPVVLLAGLCSACGGQETASRDEPAAGAVDQRATEAVADELTDDQALRVCQLGQAFRVGRDPATISAAAANDDLIRLSYTRDDGKAFRYDCKIEGDVLRFRMIDEAGPGTGPGVWSGRGSQTTFQIGAGKITIEDVFSDGSSDQETFDFP